MLLGGLLAGPNSLHLLLFFITQFEIPRVSSCHDLIVLHFVVEFDEFHCDSILVFVCQVFPKQALLLSLV